MRLFYLTLGWLFFAVGFIGIFLPVLPTTPLMLLALWCFSRSSQRFHDWLYNHRVFGPPMQEWQEYRVIPPFAKAVALISMAVSVYVLHRVTTLPLAVTMGVTGIICYGAWFILSKPSYPPDG